MNVIDDRTSVSVRPASVSSILDAPNAEVLLRAYAEECLVPNAHPQRLIYEALEQAGALKCLAAYAGSGDTLVGFVSVLVAKTPHHGQRIATFESIFVDPAYRDGGAGNALLDAVERYARDSGCACLVATARVGSRFDKVLTHRADYQLTHAQHTKWLAETSGGHL